MPQTRLLNLPTGEETRVPTPAAGNGQRASELPPRPQPVQFDLGEPQASAMTGGPTQARPRIVVPGSFAPPASTQTAAVVPATRQTTTPPARVEQAPKAKVQTQTGAS